MNKDNYILHHEKRDEELRALTEEDTLKLELENVLRNLERGMIPEDHELHKVEERLLKYFATQKKKEEVKEEPEGKEQIFQKETINQNCVVFQNVLPGQEPCPLLGDSFIEKPEMVKTLKELILKKMLPETQDRNFIHLVENGYVSLARVTLKGKEKNYYVLTSKGWNMLLQQENVKKLQNTDPSFSIPQRIILNPANWKTENIIQVAMLCEYYNSINVSEYMIFTLVNDEHLFLGTQIQNSYAVEYCLAFCFTTEEAEKETETLYEIASSNKIDTLTIIVQTEDEEKRIKMKRGFDSQKLSKLRFYIM